MPIIASFIKRPFYRNHWAWLGLAFVIYSLAGFVSVPLIIKNQLPEQIQEQLHWETALGSVIFNPYTFSLTLNNLVFKDEHQKEVLRFRQVYTDLRFSSLLEGVLTVSQIRILEPHVSLRLLKGGKDNFSTSWQAAHPTPAKESKKEAPNKSEEALPKLLFQQIKIIRGQVEVTDNMSEAPQNFTLSSINFNLKDFATYPKTGGDYQLTLSLGDSQRLNWRGNLSIVPFHSSGILKLKAIDSQKYRHYLDPYLPYNLASGKLDISAQYQFSMISAAGLSTPEFELNNALVTLNDVSLKPLAIDQPFLDFKQLVVGPISYQLSQNKLGINQISLKQPQVFLDRDKNGKLVFLPTLADKETSTTTSKGEANKPVAQLSKSKPSTTAKFSWSVSAINIESGKITWQDKQLKQPAKVQLSNLNISLIGLSDQLDQSLNYSVAYNMPASGTSQINGDMTLQPFSIKSRINLQNVDLTPASPYISNQVPIAMSSAKLSVNGQFNAQQQPSKTENGKLELFGGYEGDVAFGEFNIQIENDPKPLSGFTSLALRPLKISLSPFSIAITDVNLVEPFGRFQINKDGSNSLAALSGESKKSVAPKPEPEVAETTIPLSINRFLINNGHFDFTDLSLTPNFNLQVSQLNGEINGLSSDPENPAKLDLSALINKTTTFSAKGPISPLAQQPFANIAIKMNNLQMPTLSSYSGRFAGYKIDKGALSLNLNYKLKENNLTADNQIILDQFHLGDSVKSDQSIGLPLPLALAVIRDHNGVIKLDVPISGNINDPSFHIGGVILTAFTQIITKAATAPFALLGAVLGSSPEALQTVQFASGNAELNSETVTTLDKLSSALVKRPSLIIEIQSQYQPVQDMQALQNNTIAKQVDALRTKTNPKAPQSLTTTTAILEKLIIKQQGIPALQTIQKKWKVTATSAVIPPEGYAKDISRKLASKISTSDIDLKKLAQSRAQNILNYFKEKGKVPAEQLFIVEPIEQKDKSDAGVAAKFKLDVR